MFLEITDVLWASMDVENLLSYSFRSDLVKFQVWKTYCHIHSCYACLHHIISICLASGSEHFGWIFMLWLGQVLILGPFGQLSSLGQYSDKLDL
jgi:hypothetical protein